YAKTHDFSYKIITFDSDGESFQALQDQQVDAVVTGSLSGHTNVRIADTFGAEPFYFMTRKHNEALLIPLNEALAEIKTSEPEFESNLYKQYYTLSAKLQQPLFTRDEAEYIKQSPVLTIGNLPNRYPLSQYHEKTGELVGITEDILNLISEKSGLKFDLQPLPIGKKPMAELKARNYDLVAGVLRTDNFLRDPELSLSESFLDGKLVIVGRAGETLDLKGAHTIVMTTAFQGMQEYIQKEYPQYEILYRDNNDECLNAVKNKEADMMMQNSFVVSYWLQNPRFNALEIIPTYSLNEQTCIAANSDTDPRLISVLSKTIKILDQDTIDQYIVKHTIAKPYKLTLNDVCYKYRIPLIFLALLLVLCIALYTYVMIQRQRHVNLLQKKNEQLVEAIKQAEHANRAKSTFLSRMSHEIRTPMNAIVGITAIAGKHLKDPKRMEEYLSKIAFSSKVLLNIINDVLDMSAIESDKLKISNNPFDFKQLLSSISAMYYPQCKQKEIAFDLLLDGVTEETLIGDQLRVNQILLNLLSNAVKFTPKKGKIKLKVSQLTIREQQVFM
ncbi:MAG: transporter substrate-binding domain-containing protein, partial [Hungatella sp.]